MARLSLLFAAALVALPAAAQCTQTRAVNGQFVETSTGPYAPGSTFEATLVLSSSVAGEDLGVSTMVLDYNNEAMTYAAAPVNGTDYEWLMYQQFRPTIDGNTAAYTSDVRVTNPSRLTPFVDLGFTSSPTGRGETLPTAPTPVLRIRFTVVDATKGIVVTPRSQQFFNGPGGPSGCYATGTWTGLEAGQQVLAGAAGWRMLAPPAGGLSPIVLASFNHLQGIPGYTDGATPNLLAGYNGTAYLEPGAAAAPIAPGTGMLWYLYAAADFPGGTPTPAFRPLPFTLHHDGPAAASFRTGGEIGASASSIPLHTAGNRWNLVGNPFATGLDVTQLAPVGGVFNSAVVQVWDPGPAGAGTYVLSSTLGGRVAGWQGFFLENSTATALSVPVAARATGTFVTREAAPDTADSLAAETVDDETARVPTHTVAFTLDGQMADGTSTLDRALVLVLDPAASEAWDLGDATKLMPLAPQYAALAIAGIGSDDTPVLKAQESRPLSEAGFSVALALDVVGGDAALTLRWDPSALPEDVPVALRDVVTGETVDLHTTDQYAFTAAGASAARGALDPATSLVTAQERFVLAVGQVLPVARSEDPVVELALDAPSPNPFRDRAVVRYALPTAGPIRVAVYDVLGREVAVLVDGEAAAGRYETSLRGGALAAGMYVVRLVSGEQTLLRRVTVIR